MARVPQRLTIALLGLAATTGTSISFVPAVEGKKFLVIGFVLSAIVVGIGLLMRALRAPLWAVIPVQFLVLFETLVLMFADHRKFGVLPTRGSLQDLADVFQAGSDKAQALTPPVPASQGIMLMIVLAIAVTALCVDAIAVGFHRVPLAGLPLLALYTIPVAALQEGIPWYTFVPGAALYVAMLTYDERDRLGHWGRLVTRDMSTSTSDVDLTSVRDRGRQIGVAALGAAVILPIIIPTFSASILDGGRDGGDGEGGNGKTLSFSDPMVSLARSLQEVDDVPLLEISSPTAPPSYLRLTTLDTPGPDEWSASDLDSDNLQSLDSELPVPTGLSESITRRAHDMTIAPTGNFPSNSRWLPVPFFSTAIDAGSDFSYVTTDQTVAVTSSSSPFGDLQSYNVKFDTSDLTAEELANAGTPPQDIIDRYSFVPDGVPAVVGDVARQVTEGAATPYDEAVLLQNYFRDQTVFSYDVNAEYGTGYNAMADFLAAKTGFCQQYAATMAMMARILHIPSRVVVGFLQATDSHGNYVMTSHDLHAWPELYFAGSGWVRFEPTPGVTAPFPPWAPKSGGTIETSNGPTLGRSLTEPTLGTTGKVTSDTANPGASGGGGSGGAKLPLKTLLAVLIVAIAIVPAGARRALRRNRLTKPIGAAESAEAAWAELRDRIIDLRLSWSGSMTPRAREAALASYLGGDIEAEQALHRLAIAVERARFASRPSDDDPAVDVEEVTAAISNGCTKYQRFRATFLPASLRPDIRTSWDGFVSRLRRQEA